MSHQDTDRLTVSTPNHQDLMHALDWLSGSAQLGDVAFRKDCRWTAKALIFVAILWAWSDEKTLTERSFLARKVVIAMSILAKLPAKSYQAFIKVLKRSSVMLKIALVAAFRHRMQTDLADRFEVCGFQVFGVDGSRLELARTESNEEGFSPAAAQQTSTSKSDRNSRAARDLRSREKKTNSPQMWLTTMFHVGTGLPWDWRTGPSDSSERDHFRQMIDALPKGALVTADAGFVGYEYWKAILGAGTLLRPLPSSPKRQ